MKHLILAAFAACFAVPALTQNQPQNCAPRADVLEHLATNFGEHPRAIGLNANDTVMELFVSESGSWTITITLTNGLTCLAAAGQALSCPKKLEPRPVTY